MKIVIALALVAILAGLAGAGLYKLRKRSDAAEGPDNRMARALALRVGLSVTLFVLILLAYMLGWIEPSGVPLRP